MKKKYYYNLFIFFAICIVLSACVTKGKFLASQDWVHKLEGDSASTHNLLNKCNANLTETTNSLGDCNNNLNNTKAQVKKLEDEKAGLQAQNASVKSDLENLSNKTSLTIAEQQKRLKDLQDLIQSQRDVMNRLKKTISDALMNFKPDELSVYIKDGNVYVSLQEKLLFKSGSAVVDPKGKEALGNLAAVLNVTPDITVNIEGHTDTVAIKNDKFEDNWALSTGRAASIVRILTNNYHVDPHRITASGRGEFHPVKSNDTPEGKSANRRTEIILSPNLSELYKLLGQS
jgi:chemotaxis protein MotB